MSRTYTEADRARAIAFVGDDHETATALGIPRRNVSRWRAEYRAGRHQEAAVIVERVHVSVAEEIADLRRLTLERMREKMNDPHARLGEIVQAFRELDNAARLDEGSATARTASMNVNATITAADMSEEEQTQLRHYLEQVRAERPDWLEGIE
jgi:transposase-like protein